MSPSTDVIAWLLDGDPAVRWQVMRDLTGAPADEVAAERARVATHGMGAHLLGLQADDGSWGGVAWNHGWDSTMHVLTLLWQFGLDPNSDHARTATAKVRDGVHWMGWDADGTWRGSEFVGNPYFDGEVEPCINGQVAASGAYFGHDVQRITDLLLNEQLSDGGWNCEAERGSTRSSFHTTICVLEALLEIERAGNADVRDARLRGLEYLLERGLMRRRSTGEIIDDAFTRFAFPAWWHYDVLRGLDHLRDAGVTPDERVAEAVEVVASKCDADGHWPVEIQHPGTMPVEVDASRWNTLRSLRVLSWHAEQTDDNDRAPAPQRLRCARAVKPSPDIVDALSRFYDRLTAGDLAAFDSLVSSSPATSIMGTAPGEWVTERDRLRFGFETEGVGLTPGADPVAYADGHMGFAVDEPLFAFPDGSAVRIRLSTVWRREDDVWKLVHGHFSSGVPDEEVVGLQRRWGLT